LLREVVCKSYQKLIFYLFFKDNYYEKLDINTDAL